MPVFGQALWSYEMPVMKRYSQEYLNRNPDKRGKDLETARLSCERLKNQPFTIINFVEGTRFTQLKKQKKGSNFEHLLQPKAGGVHMVLSNLGSQLDGILDMTFLEHYQRACSSGDYPGQITHHGRDFCTEHGAVGKPPGNSGSP